MIALIAIAVVVVLLVLLLIGIYNGLAKGRNQVDAAYSQVEVQLTKRHDLVPNLVATVKGYAAHESGTFEAVTAARTAAVAAQGPAQQSAAEAQLNGALGRLLAISEAYPDLKASANFRQLQDELESVENGIAYSRQYYNDSVRGYQNGRTTFPRNLVAGIFGFGPRDYFAADPGSRGPVTVDFS